MTVINWHEDTRQATTSKEVSGFTYIGDGSRQFVLDFDPATDPIAMPIEACDYTGIPQLWATHPYDPYMFVTKITPTYESASSWRVTVQYQRQENPLDQTPEESWTFNDTDEPIDRDKDNNPITNSSNEPFDPPITENYSDGVYRCVKNLASIDIRLMQDYKNAVNSDTWRGFPPRTCLLKVFDADKIKAAGMEYYRVTIEIHVRYDSSNPQASGWTRRIKDQGYRTIKYKTTGNDSSGNPIYSDEPDLDAEEHIQYKVATDAEGNLLSQPIELDGMGRELKSGDTPVFLEFNTKKERSFWLFP